MGTVPRSVSLVLEADLVDKFNAGGCINFNILSLTIRLINRALHSTIISLCSQAMMLSLWALYFAAGDR